MTASPAVRNTLTSDKPGSAGISVLQPVLVLHLLAFASITLDSTAPAGRPKWTQRRDDEEVEQRRSEEAGQDSQWNSTSPL